MKWYPDGEYVTGLWWQILRNRNRVHFVKWAIKLSITSGTFYKSAYNLTCDGLETRFHLFFLNVFFCPVTAWLFSDTIFSPYLVSLMNTYLNSPPLFTSLSTCKHYITRQSSHLFYSTVHLTRAYLKAHVQISLSQTTVSYSLVVWA